MSDSPHIPLWLSHDAFTVTSSSDVIEIFAKEKITLKGGQTSITLDGANIVLKMRGLLDVKGASKTFVGPKGVPAELPALPRGAITLPHADPSLGVKYDEQVVFKDALQCAIEGRLRFKVSNKAEQDQFLEGISPEQGETNRLDTSEAQPLEQALRYARFKFEI